MNSEISTKKAPAAIGPYSQGIHTGEFVFVSGQMPINPETGNIDSDTIEGQTKQSLENVKSVLAEAGFELNDVVKTTCFIVDMNDFKKFNAIYSEYFVGTCPARSCVAVKELPKSALCEIEVIAHK